MLYVYKGVTYTSEERVRKEIWNQERKALPKLTSAEDWAKYGVACETPIIPHLERHEALDEIRFLKDRLSSYDYIGVKIATGSATREEYASQIEECERIRSRINELRKVINDAK